MQIEKFTHLENGKTLYAVIGEPSKYEALLEVCRYKKESQERFFKENTAYTGLIKGKKLYLINIDVEADFGKDLKPCYVIAKDSIDLDNYING